MGGCVSEQQLNGLAVIDVSSSNQHKTFEFSSYRRNAQTSTGSKLSIHYEHRPMTEDHRDQFETIDTHYSAILCLNVVLSIFPIWLRTNEARRLEGLFLINRTQEFYGRTSTHIKCGIVKTYSSTVVRGLCSIGRKSSAWEKLP